MHGMSDLRFFLFGVVGSLFKIQEIDTESGC